MDHRLAVFLVFVTVIIYRNVGFATAFETISSNQEVLKYTDWRAFINDRTGQDIDITKLLQEYALICPIRQKCMNLSSSNVVKIDHTKNSNKDCPTCSCDSRCIDRGDCCPDTVYGYLRHECINTNIFPIDVIRSKMVISKCSMNKINANTQSYLKCTEENNTEPVTSLETSLKYKNTDCALCNDDNNTIPWKISVSCPSLMSSVGEGHNSVSELMKKLKQNHCHVFYQNSERNDTNESDNICETEHNTIDSINNTQGKNNFIDRCNVTGLWKVFDKDIEWACANLNLKYGLFKNVFCYVCNPSITSSMSAFVIDTCNVTGEWDNARYDKSLVKSCKIQPNSKRLNPYKNIYCMLCNGMSGSHGSHFMRFKHKNMQTDILSNLNVEGNTVFSYITGSFIFNGKDSINTWKTFANKSFNQEFLIWSNNYRSTNSSMSDENAIRKQLDAYTTVCGDHQCEDNKLSDMRKTNRMLKNTSTSDQFFLEMLISNPVCKAWKCSCDSSCAALNSCCPDYIISKQPYACRRSNAFPSTQSKTRATYNSNQRITDSTLFNSSFMIIDKCISPNASAKLSRQCSQYRQQGSNILQNIPVQTDNVAYRNLYCLECSADRSIRLRIEFQVQCDKFLESSLIPNIDIFIRLSLKACLVSFIPAKSQQCVTKDNENTSNKLNLSGYSRGKITFNTDEDMYSSVMVPFYNETNIYSTCNDTGQWRYVNTAIRQVCEDYSATTIALQAYELNGQRYRNFACFLCNPEIDETTFDMNYMVSQCNVTGLWKEHKRDEMMFYEHKCNTTEFQPRWLPFRNLYCSECNLPPLMFNNYMYKEVDGDFNWPRLQLAPSYRTLFSLSPSIAKLMENVNVNNETPTCGNGTYDEIMKKCRDLFCQEGKVLFNGSCIYLVNEASKHYKLSIKLQPLLFTHGQLNVNFQKYVSQEAHLYLSEVCKNLLSNVQGMLLNTSVISMMYCRVVVDSMCDQNYSHRVVYNETSNIRCDIILNLYSTNLTNDEEALVKALSANYTFNNGLNENILFTASSVQNIAKVEETHTTIKTNYCKYVYNNNEPEQLLLAAVLIQDLDNLLVCTQLELQETEYTFTSENKSITLTLHNRSILFTQDEFKFNGQRVRVCTELYINKTNISSTNTLRVQLSRQ